MSDEIERLLVRVEANASQFEAQMKKINRSLYGVAAENRKTMDRMKRDAERAGQEIGQALGRGLRTGSLLAGTALVALSGYAIKLASDADEIRNAFDVAFRDASTSARAFSDTLSDKVGRDTIMVQEAMSRLQLVITGTGVEAKQSAELVKALTERAVDVGSLFNTSDAEAYQSFISGLTGETEPLKKFGVVINEVAVKQELMRLGFKGNTQQASEAAKTIARANLILQKTSVAQGDAAKTADGAANSAKRMQAEFAGAARELGEQLLPYAVKATVEVTKLVKAFSDMPAGVQLAGLAVLGFIAAGGPIAGLLANLGKVIKLAQAARGALIGVTGGSAAAGAAGAGGAGVGAAGALAAPAAVGVLGGAALYIGDQKKKQYDKVLANPKAASDEDLAAAVYYARTNFANQTADGGSAYKRQGSVAQKQYARFGGALGKLRAEQNRREFGAGGGGSVDTAPVAGFTLSPDLMEPVAGSGGGRGAGGRAAAAQAEREASLKREQEARRKLLDLEYEINLAQASGDTARLKALEAEKALGQDIEDLKAAGLSAADAEYVAIMRRLKLNEAEIAQAERLLSVKAATFDANPTLVDSGIGAAGEALIAQEDAMRDTFRRTFGDGVRAALQGDLQGFFLNLADRFTDRLIDNLSDQLFNLLNEFSKSQQGSGSGNWFSGALQAFSGFFQGGGNYAGGFATGGSFGAGQWATVGENGPEAIYGKPGGGVQVLSNGALRSMRSQMSRPMPQAGGVVMQSLNFDLKGAVVTSDLLRQMEEKSQSAGRAAYAKAVETSRKGMLAAQGRFNLLGTP
jgi:hypothetical protein